METLYGIDVAVFHFCNQTLSNPVFDWLMPLLTDLNKHWWGLSAFALAWLALCLKGGNKGRTVAVLLILLVVMTDQFNSAVLKSLFHRPRPCGHVAGVPVIENIRLLVDCGSGYSFPSSHAANNFGAAFLLAFFYRSRSWAFYLFAGTVAFSRISVGVHYPSDVLGGIVVGAVCAALMILVWRLFVAQFPWFAFEETASSVKPSSGDA